MALPKESRIQRADVSLKLWHQRNIHIQVMQNNIPLLTKKNKYELI